MRVKGMVTKRFLVAGIFFFFFGSGAPASTGTGGTGGYSVTLLTAYTATATAINDAGQIVGYTGSRGFEVSGGVMSFYSSLGGGTEPTAISNSGLMVGVSTNMDDTPHPIQASTPPGITDLGAVSGYTGGWALSVNFSGEIAGFAADRSGSSEAAIYTGGQWTDLGFLGSAKGVNDSGMVVGQAYSSNTSPSEAFVYSGGVTRVLETLGGISGYASGINNAGQIIGASVTSNGAQHAFLYQNSTISDLGVLPGYTNSFPLAINNSGVIVGYCSANAKQDEPFIYENGQLVDLNTLLPIGSALVRPLGLNTKGQIVGFDDRYRAVLLNPVVPEPKQMAVVISIWFFLMQGIKRKTI